MSQHRTDLPAEPAGRPRWLRGLALSAGLAASLVAWEYLLNALFNPEVAWNPAGLAAHAGLDLLLALPLVALALAVGPALARRLGLRPGEAGGFVGAVGTVSLVFLLATVPVTTTRDLAHEWMGDAFGLSLAEVQTTVVGSDLTVSESTQLCSFSTLRNPSLARDGYQDFALTLLDRLAGGLEDALVQLALFLPAVFCCLLLTARPRPRWRMAPASARLAAHPVRWAAAGLAALAVAFYGFGSGTPTAGSAHAGPAGIYNACTEGGPMREYHVSAIDVTLPLNRWGDHVRGAHMYALDANIPEIRAFEAALEADRMTPEGLGVTRVSHGLRKDPIQPLVLRANLGECVRIHFTNRLEDGQPSSLHLLGLAHSVDSAGGAVGENPDTFAAPGATVSYEIPLPLDPEAERAYYFHDHGAGRRRQNMGLFGALVAEPRGATYLDVETGEPLDDETGSNWEAIILDPDQEGRPDGKSFREFVIFYHEIGDEAFTDIRDREDKKLPLVDEVGGVYRPAARALNYRSEPFRHRLQVEKTGKSLGYSSYPFGDPATPIPRSYVGEATKTRLLHGGSEVFHVHHLHGGGDRWRRSPNADPANDFWKGLTKVPDPNLTSIHLDSQSIGPGTSYNLEHECGAGGCQQGVGDFLYHCHIGHHYLAGMWSFWRVFGTLQTAETNLYGRPLAVVAELFQSPDNPLIPPAPPEHGVSAGQLLGLTVDGGRVLTEGPTSGATKNILEWIEEQLPPRGVRLDKQDATVWDWSVSGSGADLRVWGEPEPTESFPGYASPSPGQRPEVLFNRKNGRYSWPLFHPQKGMRPPFSARHSGAPWLGEEMAEGRLDGLCAVDGLAGVDLGGTSVKRYYPVSAITLPIGVTADREDPEGKIFVLNEEEAAVRRGDLPAEPLAIRSNVGDCVEVLFTNKIPDDPAGDSFSKVNIHSHFVQFDTQASDGVITGFSYEQSVRPIASENRRLAAAAPAGSQVLSVNHTGRLRPGVWLGIGLGEATCGHSPQGQPIPCTEVRRIVAMPDGHTLVLDRPLSLDHGAGEAVGVEFVRYLWYPDVDVGTVFFHTHVDFKDWDHGLFGAHIVEPKGSTYHDPTTGREVRSGTLVDVRVDPAAGGNPVAAGVTGSFREFMLFLHNNSPVEGGFQRGGGTINLRAEPWRLRPGEPAWRFSSVTHGDPFTPLVRAYVGDPVVVRGMGLVERVGGIRFTGHRFHQERTSELSDTRDTTPIGISERFDLALEGGAGGPGGFPGDYLYYSTLGRDFEAGAWGILRVHDTARGDLQPLPDRPRPTAGQGFPRLSFTGEAPPSFAGPGTACPADVPRREYAVVVRDAAIVYNELTSPDVTGVVYHLKGQPSTRATTPLVMRVNAGECLVVKVRNNRSQRSSISVGELLFDPQRSYGSAVGYNYDSTVAAGRARRYEYYADRELGLVLALNLGDVDSVGRGAFAGVVVEPPGTVYRRPGRDEALPQGGVGVQADLIADGTVVREFVALFNDQDRRIGQNHMPYPARVENYNGINYSFEPLSLRGMRGNPAGVFRSALWGDPRHVVRVPAGTPLVYRVALAWGDQPHVPTLEGHRWRQEPGMAGSEQVFSDLLLPGMSLDLQFVGGAGGDTHAPGDNVFLDRRQPFMEGGMWNLLRVTDDGTSGAPDRVRLFYATVRQTAAGNVLEVRGANTIRPAGDFAPQVTVHAGGAGDGGGCPGPVLGSARVDPGAGGWRLRQLVGSPPAEVCVTSPGGGAASAPVSP